MVEKSDKKVGYDVELVKYFDKCEELVPGAAWIKLRKGIVEGKITINSVK